MVGNCGATPPASKKITRLGPVVRWANMAAAHGTPVPTATLAPSSRTRAAQQTINSIALYDMPPLIERWLQSRRQLQESKRLRFLRHRVAPRQAFGFAFVAH